MSTIDRVIVYNKPCPCGVGQIVITECSPDHPYVRDSQIWYHGDLNCGNCVLKFKIDEITRDDDRIIILRPNEGNDIVYLKNINRYCQGLHR